MPDEDQTTTGVSQSSQAQQWTWWQVQDDFVLDFWDESDVKEAEQTEESGITTNTDTAENDNWTDNFSVNDNDIQIDWLSAGEDEASESLENFKVEENNDKPAEQEYVEVKDDDRVEEIWSFLRSQETKKFDEIANLGNINMFSDAAQESNNESSKNSELEMNNQFNIDFHEEDSNDSKDGLSLQDTNQFVGESKEEQEGASEREKLDDEWDAFIQDGNKSDNDNNEELFVADDTSVNEDVAKGNDMNNSDMDNEVVISNAESNTDNFKEESSLQESASMNQIYDLSNNEVDVTDNQAVYTSNWGLNVEDNNGEDMQDNFVNKEEIIVSGGPQYDLSDNAEENINDIVDNVIQQDSSENNIVDESSESISNNGESQMNINDNLGMGWEDVELSNSQSEDIANLWDNNQMYNSFDDGNISNEDTYLQSQSNLMEAWINAANLLNDNAELYGEPQLSMEQEDSSNNLESSIESSFTEDEPAAQSDVNNEMVDNQPASQLEPSLDSQWIVEDSSNQVSFIWDTNTLLDESVVSEVVDEQWLSDNTYAVDWEKNIVSNDAQPELLEPEISGVQQQDGNIIQDVVDTNVVDNTEMTPVEEVKDDNWSEEIQSTLSLDEILDSELLSSEQITQTVASDTVKSSNKMVAVVAWIWLCIMAGFVYFLAFPNSNSKILEQIIPSSNNDLVAMNEWESVHWSGDIWDNVEDSAAEDQTSNQPSDDLIFPSADEGEIDNIQQEELSLDEQFPEAEFSEMEFPEADMDANFPNPVLDMWSIEDPVEDEEPSLYVQDDNEFLDVAWQNDDKVFSYDEIELEILSFKSQAEQYYSYGQEVLDRFVIKYASQMLYLCDQYLEAASKWEKLDWESLEEFKWEITSLIIKIDAYNENN